MTDTTRIICAIQPSLNSLEAQSANLQTTAASILFRRNDRILSKTHISNCSFMPHILIWWLKTFGSCVVLRYQFRFMFYKHFNPLTILVLWVKLAFRYNHARAQNCNYSFWLKIHGPMFESECKKNIRNNCVINP